MSILKKAVKLASTIIPGGSVIKGLLGFAAEKIPGAEEVLNKTFSEAEKMYQERSEIRQAYLEELKESNRFLLESEGRYEALRTKFENIVRSMQRPFLTIICVINLIIMIYLKIPFPDIFGIITAGLVASLAGTKALRDYKRRK